MENKIKCNSVLGIAVDIQCEIESFLLKYNISHAYKDLLDLISYCEEKKIEFIKILGGLINE